MYFVFQTVYAYDLFHCQLTELVASQSEKNQKATPKLSFLPISLSQLNRLMEAIQAGGQLNQER